MNKIQKGDMVKVVRGKDSGKEGEVLVVKNYIDKNRINKTKVKIKGVGIVKKHQKPLPQFNVQGGIIETESFIDASNVMYLDTKTGLPSRIGFMVDEATGKKYRIIKKSGEIIKK